MQKLNFNSEERQEFQRLMKEFIDEVERMAPQGTRAGSEITRQQNEINELLKKINYVSNVNYGSGNLANYPAISFYRQDILGEEFINSEKATLQRGIYIWFSYAYRNKILYLKIGAADGYENNISLFNCKAFEQIKNDTGEFKDESNKYCLRFDNFTSKDFDNIKETITDKFLELVNYFNTFPKEDFIRANQNGTNTVDSYRAQNTLSKSIKESPLNQILYGPPGTGKTYNTINKALEILLEYKQIEKIPESREEQRVLFKKFKEQIAFITFHQSYSYEEFVEGIKPDFDKEDLTYKIENGIFKSLCEKAFNNYKKHYENNNDKNKIDTKELFQAYALELKQKLDEEQSLDFFPGSKMKIQSIFYKGNGEVSIGIGTNKDKNSMQTLTQKMVLRDYENFKNGSIKTYKDIKPTYESQSQWHGNAIYYFELYKGLKDFEQKEFKDYVNIKEEKVELKPYILIIDEINRGNISKILGELITLLEEDKRIGAKEELQVTLPYSNDSFGVPKNLYIIGTMNTADRSIALIDTALRRRFEFIEMMPQPEELKDCEGIDLKELLIKMNERIEFLLDREHSIGHAFFIDVKNIADVKKVFQNKIIPLLQEYFYEDYAKIDAVLNGNGMIKSYTMKDLSINLSDDFVDSDKKIYRITDSSKWSLENFQKIYDSNKL